MVYASGKPFTNIFMILIIAKPDINIMMLHIAGMVRDLLKDPIIQKNAIPTYMPK
jgi:hypothetical protein|tara:strand:+ start:185 stop:349 length:165 start_codon:yes stop_codon:yes gene_type:complete